MTHDGTRKARGGIDEALVVALAQGLTQEDAAAAAGVSRRTVSRRVAEETFRRRLEAARRDMLDSALGRLSHAATKAARTLEELAVNAESESVRLDAARSVLDLAVRLGESQDLALRLQAVEEAVAERGDESA